MKTSDDMLCKKIHNNATVHSLGVTTWLMPKTQSADVSQNVKTEMMDGILKWKRGTEKDRKWLTGKFHKI